MRSALARTLLLPAVLLLAAETAHAQGGFGLRAGISADPDQFYLGAHVDAGPLVKRLWFRPNLEIGFGDDLTLVALNAELAYFFPTSSRWSFYVGGGPALNIYDAEGSDSDTEAGLNFLIGASHRGGFFVEVKAGAYDSPDLKFAFGYSF